MLAPARSLTLTEAEEAAESGESPSGDSCPSIRRCHQTGEKTVAWIMPLLKTDISPSWLIVRAKASFNANMAARVRAPSADVFTRIVSKMQPIPRMMPFRSMTTPARALRTPSYDHTTSQGRSNSAPASAACRARLSAAEGKPFGLLAGGFRFHQIEIQDLNCRVAFRLRKRKRKIRRRTVNGTFCARRNYSTGTPIWNCSWSSSQGKARPDSVDRI